MVPSHVRQRCERRAQDQGGRWMGDCHLDGNSSPRRLADDHHWMPAGLSAYPLIGGPGIRSMTSGSPVSGVTY